MKAITVKQPWAFLIVSGLKDIENRTWPTKFRGRVLIHASLDKRLTRESLNVIFTDDQLDRILNKYDDYNSLGFGAILGSVDIVDCVINHSSIWAEKTVGGVSIYNWVLSNPIMFDEVIPIKGKLSFWESGIELCHICGRPTSIDFLCELCGDYYCEKCGAKYNQFTQIDFNCCVDCSDRRD